MFCDSLRLGCLCLAMLGRSAQAQAPRRSPKEIGAIINAAPNVTFDSAHAEKTSSHDAREKHGARTKKRRAECMELNGEDEARNQPFVGRGSGAVAQRTLLAS